MNIHAQPSAEQLQAYMQHWQAWVDGLVAQNRLESGNHLSVEGRVLYSNNRHSDTVYTINNESVAGYFLVKAHDFDDAERLAKDCPILQGEGTN
eukprot:gene15142-19341_t